MTSEYFRVKIPSKTHLGKAKDSILDNILSKEEGKTLELKENSKPIPQIIKTVIAFANTAGGTIIIGIKDKTKEIIGVKNILQEEERLANAIADSLEPMLIPDIEIQNIRNRELLMIKVPHLIGPYYLKSIGMEKGTYIRLGSTNRLADTETMESLKRLSKNVSFDELPCIGARTVNFPEESLSTIFHKAELSKTKKNFKALGLTVNHLGSDYPTNGGVLLIADNRLDFFPDSTVRCVCFKGDDRDEVIDEKEIAVDLISAVDQILNFIERHTSITYKIGRKEREEIAHYPEVATREAVINAIVHTDYSMTGTSIQIAIFSNRIEITNPGGLPYGQTLEYAMSGISRMRNRVIGKVFRKMKLIEKLGSGLRRIFKAYTSINALSPVLEELNNHFRITLYSSVKPSKTFDPWESLLIKKLSDGSKMSTKTIAEIWNVSDRTARTRLKKMANAGIVERIATAPQDPRAGYILSEKYLR